MEEVKAKEAGRGGREERERGGLSARGGHGDGASGVSRSGHEKGKLFKKKERGKEGELVTKKWLFEVWNYGASQNSQ